MGNRAGGRMGHRRRRLGNQALQAGQGDNLRIAVIHNPGVILLEAVIHKSKTFLGRAGYVLVDKVAVAACHLVQPGHYVLGAERIVV